MLEHLICIGCPKGCKLTADLQGHRVIITGHSCPKGEEYARQELFNPRRIVTTTVKITHAIHSQLPVVTSQPVLKQEMMSVIKALREIEVQAPVFAGQLIVAQSDTLPCDVIASRDMEKIS